MNINTLVFKYVAIWRKKNGNMYTFCLHIYSIWVDGWQVWGYEIKPMEDFYIQCDVKKLAGDSAL